MSERQLRVAVGACGAAVAAFLGTRAVVWPPHEDETLALFVGRGSLGSLFEVVLAERGGAPLHFVLGWISAHAGGLVTLRLFSALFAVASIPLVAALARRLAGPAAALVATVLASASWILLFHGVYGRMYSLFLFTSALAYLALLRALDDGGGRRWVVWALAVLACVATHPYGALVLASQGGYVLLVRRRLREALVAFAAVAVAGIPFWWTDLVLAGRFEVGVGGGGGKLGRPLPVLHYLWEVARDFSVGWMGALVPILLVAALGTVRLARERRESALLVGAVVLTPTAAFLLARLGGSASPESRHLIFALPFFATVLAVGILRARPPVAAAVVATLVVGEVGWAWTKTPSLFEGEPRARTEAREDAGAWLARTSRADDVFFGYEPVYLEAWERDAGVARTVVPRADPRLAARGLEELPRPIGRAVFVFDAYKTNSPEHPRRLTIGVRTPRPRRDYEARVFGPYLVLRTVGPTRTPAEYLDRASQVMIAGKTLLIGDADINFVTVRRAGERIYGRSRSSRSTSSR